jgi:hypothetical protein
MQSTVANRADRVAIGPNRNSGSNSIHGANSINGANNILGANGAPGVASAKYTDGNADLVRGILIALGLLGICLGAFALVAYHERLHARDVLDRVVSFVAPAPSPTPKPVKKRPVPAGTGAPLANPSAAGGASPDGGGAGGAAPAANASAAAPAPATAAQALRQVLHNFRGDPKGTATITISSSGKIAQISPGPLTHDELPMEAVDGATLITGAAPVPRRP